MSLSLHESFKRGIKLFFDSNVRKLEIDKMSEYKLLTSNDPAPLYVLREEMILQTPNIVICDHAGEAFPEKLNFLGITDGDRKKHITYDIGTKWIGEYIGEKLNAVTFVANYSRLVVDVNRDESRDDFMPQISDNIIIPGNRNISSEEKWARIDEIYLPYQNSIRSCVDEFLKHKIGPFLLSIHSFTPFMNGKDRPWEIGILWSEEHSIPKDIIKSLRDNNPELSIGDNEPYSLKAGKDYNNTVELQATSRGLPSLVVEFRQDMVDTKEKAQKMADILLESLIPLLKQYNLYRKTA